jgi:hypothetical protein
MVADLFRRLGGNDMTLKGWIILVIVNIPLYLGIAWVLFRTWGNFWRSIWFWLTPDRISMLRGKYFADRWAEFKLFLWLILCIACVIAEAYLISKYFG